MANCSSIVRSFFVGSCGQRRQFAVSAVAIGCISFVFANELAYAVPNRKAGDASKRSERHQAEALTVGGAVLSETPIGIAMGIYQVCWISSLSDEDEAAFTVAPRGDFDFIGLPPSVLTVGRLPIDTNDPRLPFLNEQIGNFEVLINTADSYKVSVQRFRGAVLAGDLSAANIQRVQALNDFSTMQSEYQSISQSFTELASLFPGLPIEIGPSDLIDYRHEVMANGLSQAELNILQQIGIPPAGLIDEITLSDTDEDFANFHVSSVAGLFQSSSAAINSFDYSSILAEELAVPEPTALSLIASGLLACVYSGGRYRWFVR
jgi:hypothetical protein